jgi:PhnB protein
MLIQPYLNFEGRCEEAFEFYSRALGGQVTMRVRYKDSPDPLPPGMMPPGCEDKMMHARCQIGDTTLLASDGRCTGRPDFKGFSLSLTVTSQAEGERCFAGLAEGGQVKMPLMKTFFSPCFGMLEDRFGVSWMIYMAP